MKQGFYKMFSIVMALSLLSLFSACKDGDNQVEDTIGLSTEKITFSAQGGTQQITTEGDSWAVTGISMDGKKLKYEYEERPSSFQAPFRINTEVLTLERPETMKTLIIKLDENPTEQERIIEVSLFDRDFHTDITIKQEGKK